MRIEKSSPTVFTPLEDGTGVLLNLETLFYYSLNATAAVLWQELDSNKSVTVDDLVQMTCDRFDVGEAAARSEISAFVERLEQFKIIHVS